MNTKFIRVDEWRSSKEDAIVTYDGKLIIVPFDKIFGNEDIRILNTFNILKDSYVNKLSELVHYINYFLKFYDTEHELLLSYVKLKSMIDNKDRNISIPIFIQFVYNILLSDSIREKIIKMVDDNSYIKVSSNDGKKYNESLEFTDDHVKIMMQISMSMKLMIPIMFHYINKIKYSKEREKVKGIRNTSFKYKQYIYRFYAGLFDIYGSDEIDIYNKLWISTWSRINVNYTSNKIIWEQRAIYGTTPISQLDELLRDKIICETMFRYTFDKNIINFNHVILRNQLGFFIIEPYETNRIELNSKKDVNGLSGLDKLEMNATKIDESIVILSNINIKETIKRLEKMPGMKVSNDEIEYYRNHLRISKFHVQLVFYYYAKYFSGYRDLNFLSRRKYLKLLIILKRKLRLQGLVYLPEILTANIDGRLNSRTIRNDKFLTKIETSSLYQTLVNDKYSVLSDIKKEDLILNILSTLINTKFTFVNYDNPDILGQPIDVNQDVISDEFLNYINRL